MKTKTFFSVSRLAVLALACIFAIGFAACGGDDEEPMVDELLSEETTPVDFKFYKSPSFLFDYAGTNYIGSDTAKHFSKTVNLRQGKHHLVWILGLDDGGENESYGYIDDGEKYRFGVHYNPLTKQITNYDEYGYVMGIRYAETDLEVFPFFLPVQEIEYEKHLTSHLLIVITDFAQNLEMPKQIGYSDYSEPIIGRIMGVPHVKSISTANDNDYVLYDASEGILLMTHYDLWEDVYVKAEELGILCPPNGFDNVETSTLVFDKDKKTIQTVKLPKFSLHPGYTTILEGPLFSGSTSDWAVTMEPYKD